MVAEMLNSDPKAERNSLTSGLSFRSAALVQDSYKGVLQRAQQGGPRPAHVDVDYDVCIPFASLCSRSLFAGAVGHDRVSKVGRLL